MLSHSPMITTDGLVLCLDAANPRSYPGSGNTWLDLSGNNNHATKNNGVWNSNGWWDSVLDSGYYGGSHKLDFTVSDSTSLYDTFSTTTGSWTIEEVIRIDDNTYPEAAAGGVVSNSAYGYSTNTVIGFDWNHGQYNTQFSMGATWNVGQNQSGYDARTIWTLPIKFQALGVWYHRTMFWDRENDSMGFYYNAEFIASRTIGNSGLPIYDGGGINFGTLYGWVHQGARSSMKVYNKKLTTDEIRRNYLATKSRFGL